MRINGSLSLSVLIITFIIIILLLQMHDHNNNNTHKSAGIPTTINYEIIQNKINMNGFMQCNYKISPFTLNIYVILSSFCLMQTNHIDKYNLQMNLYTK